MLYMNLIVHTLYIKEVIKTIKDKIVAWLGFVSDFASKMVRMICDMAKVVAMNNAAKAKL